ncbi:hypothetical protein COHA_005532 [Chlorella ohadii]|uniref:Uncharacterized protein n=1 Tax=Chlorella ohadii TaxID=2649997 RepID=A0AAD5DPH9_9CHLO|nr:hypothetical protein COHA_005532 [Chlorella ohadii]
MSTVQCATWAAASARQAAAGQRQQRNGLRQAAPPPSRQQQAALRSLVLMQSGMYVPSDSFGGQSPERRAAQSLQTFFTFVACKIVESQLQGIGRGDLGAYNAAGMMTLRRFMQEESMRDADAWLSKLMVADELLALRIIEVRTAYAKEDFEWDNLRRVALEGLEQGNTQLLRQHASRRYTAMLERAGELED